MQPHIRNDRDHVILTCEVCRSHARMAVAEAKALAKKLEGAIAFAALAPMGINPPPSLAVGQSVEQQLLLTVARVLRATLREMAPNAERTACPVGDDIAALNEALAPFDPVKAEPVNEVAHTLDAALAIVNGEKSNG